MKRYITVKLWILLLIFGSGQILQGHPPTRILELDLKAVHVQGSAVLAADSNGNLLRSTDGGITFETRHHGTSEDAIHFINSSSSTAIAVGAGGWIQRSDDSGLSWAEVNAQAMLGDLSAVATNGQGLWVAVGRHQNAATQVSTDDGLTWTLHSVDGVNGLTGVAWHSGSNQFVASGGFSGSLHASANGSSWSSINVPSATPQLKFISSDGADGLLAGGEQGTLLRSSGSTINFSAVEGFRPSETLSETLRSAVSTAQGAWIVGGDQAIVVEVPSVAAEARLLTDPLAAAGAIVSMANRGSEEILLAGPFTDYPWSPPELQVELNGDQLTLRVQNARIGRTYRVQSSTNLNQWSNLSGTTRQATQRTLEWTVTQNTDQRFFRVLVE